MKAESESTSRPGGPDWLPLFLISFAALFFEILIIRWVSAEVRIFSYFKNLVLMGAFVGLGMGCALAAQPVKGKATRMSALSCILLLILSLLLANAKEIGLRDVNFLITPDVFNWFPHSAAVGSVTQFEINVAWVVGMFFLVVTIFDAIGEDLGQEMARYKPLYGYAVNLAGSLAGVVTYSLLAFMGTSPAVWLAVGCGCLSYFHRRPWQLATYAAAIVVCFFASSSSHWSPYYRIDLSPYMSNEELSGQTNPYRMGTKLEVNHAIFQATVDLSKPYLQAHPEIKMISEYGTYNMPYEAQPMPQHVLIMGGGTGNDAAAALRHGAPDVDVVEIDPGILQIGHEIHAEKPYDDARVHEYVDDARAFLASSTKKYDLIVYGFVDSHTALSTVSSVRLDNYLYTEESLKKATAHLSGDGVACLSFAAGPLWLRARLYQMVKQAIHEEPLVLSSSVANPNSIIILWGPGLAKTRALVEQNHRAQIIQTSVLSAPIELCTDDWPFLYQQNRQILPTYAGMLVLLIVISTLLVAMRFRLAPRSFLVNSQFFFLGAGFLLLETRAMLTTSLLFGTTWLINSIVIAGVLLMALGANWIVNRYSKIPELAGYVGIACSLLLMYVVPPSMVMGEPLPIRLLASLLTVGLSFFFSGIVFSRAFSTTQDPARALGINILGAVLGGCLEYFSIVVGSNNLILFALVIYALSFACRFVRPSSNAASASAQTIAP